MGVKVQVGDPVKDGVMLGVLVTVGGTWVPVKVGELVKVGVAEGNVPVGVIVGVLVAVDRVKTGPRMGIPLKDRGWPFPSTPDMSPLIRMPTWKVPEAVPEKSIVIK